MDRKWDDSVQYVKDRPGHDRRYAIDAGKIKKELGWEPKHRFEQSIKTTIQWYKDHRGLVASHQERRISEVLRAAIRPEVNARLIGRDASGRMCRVRCFAAHRCNAGEANGKGTFRHHLLARSGVDRGQADLEQPLQAHGDYVHQLYLQRKLVMAGPFTDSSGGMDVIDVADEAEAQAILAHDPAIQAQIFTARIHPWYCVDWQTYGSSSHE